ncbi:hypothetical protein [Bradyrhizobium jicamae]|uniref:hypothetical protein n=1 Tax=Bradyrhizobium jicamae TaxID=280332 RepID=UPI001BA84577|nr:hypothetical protein [Bradyrhizobium jicamae]MBR0937299.1 hypothetical protein [Bradyrhizobium jicamae]
MSSRHPTALSARSHDRAARKRNRRDTVALRRATAGDLQAQRASLDLGRWFRATDGRRDHDDATVAAIRYAQELIRRALERRQHVDGVLIERLRLATGRLELHVEAGRLRLHPDVLIEVRMVAAEIAAQLFQSAT